jgi:hypothetical protein
MVEQELDNATFWFGRARHVTFQSFPYLAPPRAGLSFSGKSRRSERPMPGLKNWFRLHVFRICTAVLTLLALVMCFFYSPELLTWWLRAMTRIIELVASMLPYPWGDRVEIALKALGGSFWLQITSAIVLVRMVLGTVAVGWRHRRSRRRLEPQ